MQAVYYRDRDGDEPVNSYIDQLPAGRQEEIDAAIDLLNRLRPDDPPLPFPHSSQVEGQMRELRCHYGRELYRILYRRSGNLFILLHIVAKRSRRLAQEDIAVAQERWDDFVARMNAIERKPPRAAGMMRHDDQLPGITIEGFITPDKMRL